MWLSLALLACNPVGLDERPANPDCEAPPRPSAPDASVTFARVFAEVSLPESVQLLQTPAAPDQWYVVEQNGTVWRFSDADPTSVVEALTVPVSAGGERGLLGFAFHPDFATNGYAYANLTRGNLSSFVMRYHSSDGGLTFDPDSETVILEVEQPAGNHNGGMIAFGHDGLLYTGFGDGGGANDTYGHGQNTDTLLGSMVRIDVDGGDPYGIPADNPFAAGGGAPEIYAWGLRNPWRWSFDRLTGELWLADVGQGAWEEVDRIVRGGNYGWPHKEGSHCFDAPAPCDDPAWIDPVAEYDHSGGNRSVTGGFVYRGTAFPALAGTFVYGDFYTGNLWGVRPADDGTGWQTTELATASGLLLSGFGEGLDGELYALDYGGGGIYRLEPSNPAEVAFPQRLSETGCVDPLAPSQPSAGMLGYSLNAPFWSDGLDKERYFGLPDGEQVDVAEDGDWALPVGSVALKHFRLGDDLIETRLFVRHDDGEWAGYSYAWLADGSDAQLVGSRATVEVSGQRWTFPSSGDCLQCHTDAAGGFLGLETAQLNGPHDYGRRTANQIDTLAAIALFSTEPGSSGELPALPGLADDAPVEERARAWLHTNCASCHRPAGGGGGDLDLRWTTALADTATCDVAPDRGDMGVAGAVVLAPGEPERSLLSLRAHDRGEGAMPPLSSDLVDPDGVAVLDAWIASLTACP